MLNNITCLGYRENEIVRYSIFITQVLINLPSAHSIRYFSRNLRICVEVTVSKVSIKLSSISRIACSFGVKSGTRRRERIYTPTHLHLVYSLDTSSDKYRILAFQWSIYIYFANLIIPFASRRKRSPSIVPETLWCEQISSLCAFGFPELHSRKILHKFTIFLI